MYARDRARFTLGSECLGLERQGSAGSGSGGIGGVQSARVARPAIGRDVVAIFPSSSGEFRVLRFGGTSGNCGCTETAGAPTTTGCQNVSPLAKKRSHMASTLSTPQPSSVQVLCRMYHDHDRRRYPRRPEFVIAPASHQRVIRSGVACAGRRFRGNTDHSEYCHLRRNMYGRRL